MLIGTLEKIPTRADAERAVEYRRIQINARPAAFESVTVGALIERFLAEYAPRRCREKTRRNYESLFRNHIRPRWGREFLENVKPLAVEDWLDSYPHSRQVKSHVRRLMHTLFQAALRWEMLAGNPIDLVRQPAKRLKAPRVLTPAEFKALVAELAEPYRTMVITVACLGLRVSELLGLQWGDVDFQNLTVKIERSVVEGEVNETKTEASAGVLPLDAGLAEALLAHRVRSPYARESDFIFAGDRGQPRWKDCILADYLKPAAARAGIGKVGWHTFRHTYSALLAAFGTTPAVQKELLRHANIQTTLNLYTQAVSSQKWAAAAKVARILYEFVPAGRTQEPANC
jgi:integrase